MKLSFACPYYGPTPPLVGDSQRANVMNAQEAGHVWIDDVSASNTQHRNACEAMLERALMKPETEAIFWTEHDVVLPPDAVTKLCETLEKVPEADTAAGIVFRRCKPYNPMIANITNNLTREEYENFRKSDDHQVRRVSNLLSYEEMKEKMLVSVGGLDTTAPPFRIDTASMGCLLFRRSTFERIKDIPDLFAIDALGIFSIDNAFFLRLRDLGLKLYCDPRILCAHLGDPELVTWITWKDHHLKVAAAADIKRQEKLRQENPTDRIYGELTRLCNKHGSDKGTLDHSPDSGWAGWIHRYADLYDAQLAPIQFTATQIFEIGVFRGASLKAWRDYFPNAQIHGLENGTDERSVFELEDPSGRIHIHRGDQGVRSDYAEVLQSAPFDLILDDGSHMMEHQQISLGYLFPYVKPGGWYVVEDVHTSFLAPFGVYQDASNATLNVLQALADGRSDWRSEYMTDEEMDYLKANVDDVLIYGHKSMTCMIRKKRSA